MVGAQWWAKEWGRLCEFCEERLRLCRLRLLQPRRALSQVNTLRTCISTRHSSLLHSMSGGVHRQEGVAGVLGSGTVCER